MSKLNIQKPEDFPKSHEACDAFWRSWNKYGEQELGYYEGTWRAIYEFLKAAQEDDYKYSKDWKDQMQQDVGLEVPDDE